MKAEIEFLDMVNKIRIITNEKLTEESRDQIDYGLNKLFDLRNKCMEEYYQLKVKESINVSELTEEIETHYENHPRLNPDYAERKTWECGAKWLLSKLTK